MNVFMESFVTAAATGNGGVYAGNQVNSIAPFSFRSSLISAGVFQNIPQMGNTVYYGFLRSHPADDSTDGKITVKLNGTLLPYYSISDSKPILFDMVVPDDSGANTMAAPLSFVGFRIEVPGAGVLP